MSPVTLRRFDRLLALACSTLPLACAGTQPSDPTTVTGGDSQTAAGSGGPASPVHGVMPNAAALEQSHGARAPNTSGLLRTAQTGETSYDVSAPATVLVTTRWGHGSGVHIGDGLILTNYHVIADALTADFEFRVKVTTVDIQANGTVKPGPQYEATALKVDPKRDIALLRVAGAPADLAKIALASEAPKPGRRVAAIGNAGVGFGWAVKHCNINAIGTLESRAAAMVHLRGETWTEQERAELAEYLAKAAADAGLQIQTDCTILPGDSGGPLIDEQTHELVGLNMAVTSALSQDKTIGTVAYHIHVDELREFTAQVPTQPLTWVPDPWEVAGFEGSLADLDADGELDSILVHGACNEAMTCSGLFVDADQDSFQGGLVPSLAQLYADRSFDAELVALQRARLPRSEPAAGGRPAPVSDLLLYLDRDGDRDLDSLIVLDGETEQVRGFKGLDGAVSRDPSLDGAQGLDRALYSDPDIGARVERFADVFQRPSHDPRAPTQTRAVEVEFADHDRDSRADTLYAQTRLDVRMLVDADQDSIAGFADNAAASAALAAGTIDAEFMVVNGTPMRVWYDRDGDGQHDLLLVGASLDRGVVVEATRYTPDGQAEPAPEHLGRRMLRPGLLADPAQAATLERIFADAFPQAHAAVDDGLSSFPSTAVHPGAIVSEIDGSKRGAVQVVEFDRVLVLADLDRDTFKGKAMKDATLTDAVYAGSYEAEFAFVFDGIMAWAYYDGDNDGRFETVLVSRFGDPLHAEEVFSLADTLTWATPSETTPMFDSDRFGKKLRAAFKTFEQLTLEPEAVKESR